MRHGLCATVQTGEAVEGPEHYCKELAHGALMRIETNGLHHVRCLRRHWWARSLLGSPYVAVSLLGVAVGVVAGLATSAYRPTNDPPLVQSAAADTQLHTVIVSRILVNAPLVNDRSVGTENPDRSAMRVRQQETKRLNAETLGVGSADVFDHDGYLLRRYAVIELADSSWELIESVYAKRKVPEHQNSPATSSGLLPAPSTTTLVR